MARWKELRPKYGDRIVVIDYANEGVLIKYFGVMLSDGLGRPWGTKRCNEGMMHGEWAPRESSKFSLVLVPEYRSDTGTLDWERYSALTANVHHDCASIREANARTRDVIKGKQWQHKLERVKNSAEAKLHKQIVRDTFGLDSWQSTPGVEQLAAFLIAKGLVPAPDMDAYTNEKVREALQEFTKEQAVSGPLDF